MSEIRSICVYCGSSPGQNPLYREAGLALGRAIAEHGLNLVYGGGTRGIMGAVAEGVMTAGGKVTGIIPTFLLDKEASLEKAKELSELVIVGDMKPMDATATDPGYAVFGKVVSGMDLVHRIMEAPTSPTPSRNCWIASRR